MSVTRIHCPVLGCDEVLVGSGRTDARWKLHDHLTIDHEIPSEEAERLEPL